MGVKITDLHFAYAQAEVLHAVNTEMTDGSLVCILGKNGAGKSTLFRCMMNMLNNYSGEVFIDGQNIRSYSPTALASKIAYVPQMSESMYQYTVEQMVLMGTTATIPFWGTPGEKQQQMMEEALALLRISHLQKRSYRALSGGEQRMVLIARAVAQCAKIIIMDEPCSNLDYGNQIRIMELSKELVRKGYLVIQATHNPDHALLYADVVMVIQDGIIPYQGPPDEVLTTERLSALYDVPISLETIERLNKKICIPVGGNTKDKK